MSSEYQLKNNMANSNIDNQFRKKNININNNFLSLQNNSNHEVIYNQGPKHKKNSMIITEGKNDINRK